MSDSNTNIYTNTHKHTYIQTHIHKHKHTYTYIHANIHTHKQYYRLLGKPGFNTSPNLFFLLLVCTSKISEYSLVFTTSHHIPSFWSINIETLSGARTHSFTYLDYFIWFVYPNFLTNQPTKTLWVQIPLEPHH